MKMTGMRRMLALFTAIVMVIPFASMAQASGPQGFKPNQIRNAYGVEKLPWDGSGQKIAIIGAFEYERAGADLATFNETFGLPQMNGLPGQPDCTAEAGPHPCFEYVKVESANQDAPLFWSADSTWAKEMAADVQWAHAIAPGADILLLSAKTSQLVDLMKAVDEAVAMGASVVSMSWGYPEEAAHVDWNSHFEVPGVMFIAASGDHGTDLMYPAAAPNVLAVGGTYLDMQWDGTYRSETVYNNGVGGSVGGVSQYHAAPSFQSDLGNANRSTPDVAFAAGFAGFATYVNGSWINLGGTSMGAPQWAGLIALVNEAGGQSFSDIGMIYEAASQDHSYYFNDVAEGYGACQSSDCAATAGYDYATGLGTPKADRLVPFLAGVPEPEQPEIEIVTAAPCEKMSCATEFTTAIQGSASKSGIYQKIALQGGQKYQFRVPTTGATSIRVMNTSGKVLTAFGTTRDDTAYLTWTPPSTGTYYVRVLAYNDPVDYTIYVE